MTVSALTLLANLDFLFQYPVDGAKDHRDCSASVRP